MNITRTVIPTKNGKKRYRVRIRGTGRDRGEISRVFDSLKEREEFIAEFFRNPSELKRKPREQAVAGDEGEFLETFKVETLRDAFEYYKSQRFGGFSSKQRHNWTQHWTEVAKGFEKMKVAEFKKALLKQAAARLIAKGNSQKTVNTKIGFVRTVLNLAAEDELIDVNPVANFKLPKAPEPPIEFWEREDAESFLGFANARYPRGHKQRYVYLAYLIGVNCGLRANELWALKPAAIKKSLKHLSITEQWDDKDKVFRTTKGKASRRVPLQSHVLEELEHFIAEKKLGLYDPIFATKSGRPIAHRNFARLYERNLEKWKGPQIKFHGLRHTAATLMIAGGVDLKTVQEIMGHTDIETTLKYVHLVSKNIGQTAETFGIQPSKSEPKLQLVR